MRAIIALVSILSIASSHPTTNVANPCTLKTLYSFKYFHEHPYDSKKYIQCDPWGQMAIKDCPFDTEWDSQSNYCKNLNELGNTNWHFEEIYGNKAFCAFFGKNSCQNGGICAKFDDGLRCLCFSGNSGDYCEKKEDSNGAFDKILSVFYYDFGMTTSVSLKSSQNGAIFKDGLNMNKMERYFAMYTYGQISVDTFLSYLVEDFLNFVYPTRLRLQDFSTTKAYETGFFDATKNLLFDIKYINDRLNLFFMIYEDILSQLSRFLRENLPPVGSEIHSFYDAYYLLSAKLAGLAVYSTSPNDYGVDKSQNFTISRPVFLAKVGQDVSQIMESIISLYNSQFDLHNDLAINFYIDNITQQEMRIKVNNFTTSQSTLDKLREIRFSGMELWYEMFFYGYSYILEELTGYLIIQPKQEIAARLAIDDFERESKKEHNKI